MTSIYNSILEKIGNDLRSHDGWLQPPADDDEIIDLQIRSKNELEIYIPDEYLDLLRITNGIDYNGTVFYAANRSLITGYDDRYIEGIVSANIFARDVAEMNNYLIFGESDDLLHVLNFPKRKYQTIESIGYSVYAEHNSIDTMIENVLGEAL